MSNPPDVAFLRQQANKCLMLANSINDEIAAATLRGMALEYEAKARQLQTGEDENGPTPKGQT